MNENDAGSIDDPWTEEISFGIYEVSSWFTFVRSHDVTMTVSTVSTTPL